MNQHPDLPAPCTACAHATVNRGRAVIATVFLALAALVIAPQPGIPVAVAVAAWAVPLVSAAAVALMVRRSRHVCGTGLGDRRAPDGPRGEDHR